MDEGQPVCFRNPLTNSALQNVAYILNCYGTLHNQDKLNFFQNLLQLTITSSQMQWTSDCTKALASTKERGDKKALKSLKKKQASRFFLSCLLSFSLSSSFPFPTCFFLSVLLGGVYNKLDNFTRFVVHNLLYYSSLVTILAYFWFITTYKVFFCPKQLLF